MTDLYPELLRDVEQALTGATLTNIIALKKQGEVVKTTKLRVSYNGEEYDPVDCQSVSVKLENDTILLDIILADDKVVEKPPVPQAEAVVPAKPTDIFILQGDDLEAFQMLSIFAREEHHREKAEDD